MRKKPLNTDNVIKNVNTTRPNASKAKRPSVASNKKLNARTMSPTPRSMASSINNSSRTTKTKQQKSTSVGINSNKTTTKINSSKITNVNTISSGETLIDKARDALGQRDSNGKILISRRNVIFGAIGAGVLLAGASGIKYVADKVNNSISGVDTLEVAKNQIINSEDFNKIDDPKYKVSRNIQLPYGTLAWSNSSNYVTCLVPTKVAKPLAEVILVSISTGNQIKLIDESVGQKDGFEIYDVRSTDSGIIWTEVNILQGEWKIYCSELNNNMTVSPVLVDNGNSDWETPTIAASENTAYWQVLPQQDGPSSKLNSSLHKISFSKLNVSDSSYTKNLSNNTDIKDCPTVIYTSNSRMATPVNIYKGKAVITPRAESKGVFYQLTYLDTNGNVEDKICLQQNMKPMEVGYGNNGFVFSFDAIYNYGEGISNLGTYTPIQKSTNYNNSKWLNFSRNPTSAPAWCDNYFIIRSTMAICVLDLEQHNYWVLDRPNASDDYGDYLACSGDVSAIVSYANIHDQPVSGEEKKYCSLRIWENVN